MPKASLDQPVPLTYGDLCSVRAVISHIEETQPPAKGEFETSDEYRERLAHDRGMTGLGFGLAEEFTLILPISPDALHYDADEGSFAIIGQTPLAALIPNGRYGAGMDHPTLDQWQIIFSSDSIRVGKLSALPLPRKTAILVKDRLAVAIVAQSSPPYIEVSGNQSLPYMRLPVIHILRVKAIAAAIVRLDTREPVLRLPVTADVVDRSDPVSRRAPDLLDHPTSTRNPLADSRTIESTLERFRSSRPQTQAPPHVYNPPGGGGDGDGQPEGIDNAKLSASARGAIGDRIRECWSRDAGERGADQLSAILKIVTDGSGTIRNVQIVRPGAGPSGVAFAERARRAALDAKCARLPLPPSLLGESHAFQITVSE